jgi:general secretion pathway protein C
MMTKYAFTFLNLLFIGAIVYTGVSGFYLFSEANIASLEPSAVDNTRISVSQTQRRQPLSHYNTISERNLFKTQTDNDNTPVAVNVETLEQTSLNLKLWGTVTGTDKEAFAVIEEAGNRQQNLYRIGDTVENATVKIILREKVVLSVNGKDEVLEIEKAVGRAGAPSTALSRRPLPVGGGTGSARVRTQKITLRRSMIENAIQDVNQLLSQVNIRPHFHQGQPDGLMLSRIKPNSLFMRMGLRNGDVISGVNGQNIQSVDDALSFYESLKSSDAVMVQLKRGGRERLIEYTIR